MAAGLGATLLALSGTALVTPATAAQQRAAAAPTGDYCANAEQLYGGGQYTYGRAQVCLRFGSGGNQVVVKSSEAQYYWGNAWYYASSDYPVNWNASGTVSKSGQSGSYSVRLQQPGRSGSAASNPLAALNGCGSYSVTMTFHQNGPYWTDSSNDIDSGQRSYQISVPC
ncbi:hypothetical protein ABT104_00425 [Streptomyces mobaraensis]|uniref:hypothetical protein n=1 Tax=Streptomyces mobaraensis TaxID=35621 RepID=UPI003319D046